MRFVASFTALACLAVASPVAAQHGAKAKPSAAKSIPAKPLPIFSFMGQDTETVYNSSPLTFKKSSPLDIASPLKNRECKFEVIGKTTCTDYNDPNIAGRTMNFLSMDYYNGKLYRVYASSSKYSYSDLLNAFTAKYGLPELGIEKWQAKSGASFDNATAKWKFKGGDLDLDELGYDLDSCSFEFTSTINAPPAAAPKIDF